MEKKETKNGKGVGWIESISNVISTDRWARQRVLDERSFLLIIVHLTFPLYTFVYDGRVLVCVNLQELGVQRQNVDGSTCSAAYWRREEPDPQQLLDVRRVGGFKKERKKERKRNTPRSIIGVEWPIIDPISRGQLWFGRVFFFLTFLDTRE